MYLHIKNTIQISPCAYQQEQSSIKYQKNASVKTSFSEAKNNLKSGNKG